MYIVSGKPVAEKRPPFRMYTSPGLSYIPASRASRALNSTGDAGPEDRGQSEQQARPQRTRQRKCQGCSVHRYLLKPGKSGGPLRDQGPERDEKLAEKEIRPTTRALVP
jgi:hypothetical protein